MATVITQNELLDALAKANVAPSEARTVNELAELTGIPVWRTREAIGKLAMQDRIEVHYVPRARIDGRMVNTPAYVIKPVKPAKRKRVERAEF